RQDDRIRLAAGGRDRKSGSDRQARRTTAGVARDGALAQREPGAEPRRAGQSDEAFEVGGEPSTATSAAGRRTFGRRRIAEHRAPLRLTLRRPIALSFSIPVLLGPARTVRGDQ